MVVEWRDVIGYEGLYQVSSYGDIRSLPRKASDGRTVKGRVLRPDTGKYGHERVNLYSGGLSKRALVHRIVCEAFHGPQPDGKPYVLHWDDDPTNNKSENLRWGNQSDNQRDSIRNGTHRNQYRGKKECSRGHVYTAETTYFTNDGRRDCRICIKIRHQNRKSQ